MPNTTTWLSLKHSHKNEQSQNHVFSVLSFIQDKEINIIIIVKL
jgi:hypothetical protein